MVISNIWSFLSTFAQACVLQVLIASVFCYYFFREFSGESRGTRPRRPLTDAARHRESEQVGAHHGDPIGYTMGRQPASVTLTRGTVDARKTVPIGSSSGGRPSTGKAGPCNFLIFKIFFYSNPTTELIVRRIGIRK